MKMNKRLIFAILGVVIVVLGAVFGLWSCPRGDYSGKVETVTIGVPPDGLKAVKPEAVSIIP